MLFFKEVKTRFRLVHIPLHNKTHVIYLTSSRINHVCSIRQKSVPTSAGYVLLYFDSPPGYIQIPNQVLRSDDVHLNFHIILKSSRYEFSNYSDKTDVSLCDCLSAVLRKWHRLQWQLYRSPPYRQGQLNDLFALDKQARRISQFNWRVKTMPYRTILNLPFLT